MPLTVKPINVSPRLHKKVRILAALEEKQLREIADQHFLPVVEKRIAQIMANHGGKDGKR